MYHSSCLRPRLLRREKLTSCVGPSIQRGRKNTFYGALWTAQCLICLKTVAVLKEFNMRRHWEADHRASNFGSMSPAERKDAIDRLSGNLQKTTSFFRKQTAEADKIVRAGYDVSRILTRWMKPFSDGTSSRSATTLWWAPSVLSSVLYLRPWAFRPAPFVVASRRCRNWLVCLMTWSRTLALVSSPLWGRYLSPVSQESSR